MDWSAFCDKLEALASLGEDDKPMLWDARKSLLIGGHLDDKAKFFSQGNTGGTGMGMPHETNKKA